MGWRLVLSLCIGWFGTVLPVLFYGLIRNLSWGLRLLLPDWIVHGSFAILLLLWCALMLSLLQRLWNPNRRRITHGR